jgi:hypothetical protein
MEEKDVIKKLTEARLEGISTPLRSEQIKKTIISSALARNKKPVSLFIRLAPAAALVFAAAVMTYFVVDNMNSGSKFNKRGGYWSTYSDKQEGGSSQVWPPEPSGMRDDFVMSQPGYGGTGYAVRVTGRTGAALGLNYNYFGFLVRFDEKSQCPKCQGTSIKQYSGIKFRIKGSVPVGQLLFILPYEANECVAERMTCKSLTGYADYEKDITSSVTQDWTTVMINFRLDMKQPFWADKKSIVSMDKVLENVHLFKWQYKNGDGRLVDIWIADVELF